MQVHRDPEKPPKPPTTWPDVAEHAVTMVFLLGLVTLAVWFFKS